ncbi:flavin reductase family protein [Nocardioides sp. BP30]|uniref:flavin reductase family protein n=1 Tax=Nocardioides sp. BP30 TaxID=3036374 RepID=UPI002468F5DD|nr:flavin reductase family protein [Nocardioides sp. BP30]WGL52020.1 flavin reductase family protein [Nocardioides sp. BP30]
MSLEVVDVDLQDAFRLAMGHVASPVAVVTTYASGRPVGTTVSAFMSLSMAPPMVLVSLDHRSSLLAALAVGAPLGLNILAGDQRDVARIFATPGIDRFAAVDWAPRDAAPALSGVHAWVGARVSSLVGAGDHVLVLADVETAAHDTREPLVYHQRAYGTHRVFEEDR